MFRLNDFLILNKMKLLTLVFVLLFFSFGSAQNSEKLAAIAEFQKKMNRDFKDPEHSPLKEYDRKQFEALDFFPADTSYSVVAEFVRTPYETPFEMPTTTDRKPVYVKYGEAYFTLNEKEYKLNLYQNQELILNPEYEDYLFIPFTDLTNGVTTYSGGRYLDMRIPKGKDLVIDFNKAYNPYCAYNGKYSCPIPPAENHMDMRISAGVKDFQKEGN